MSGSNKSLLILLSQLGADEDICVCASGPGEMVEACRAQGIRVIVLETFDVFESRSQPIREMQFLQLVKILVFQYPQFLIQAYRILRQVKPDILHANDPKTTFFWWPIARILKIPILSHLRGEKPFGRFISKFYEQISSKIIAVSHATKQNLSTAAQKKCVVMYNGVDTTPVSMPSVNWLKQRQHDGQVIVLVVASVVPFKGLHHLIKAVSEIPKSIQDDFQVVVVGDILDSYQAYYKDLLALTRTLSVKNITFAGWQSSVDAFYSSADILALPSLSYEEICLPDGFKRIRGSEGLPRSVLEAMAYGLPVVATNIAGIPEQIEHGKNGYLYEPTDCVELARHLQSLVQSSELRSEFGVRAKDTVLGKFKPDNLANDFRSIYKEVV